MPKGDTLPKGTKLWCPHCNPPVELKPVYSDRIRKWTLSCPAQDYVGPGETATHQFKYAAPTLAELIHLYSVRVSIKDEEGRCD